MFNNSHIFLMFTNACNLNLSFCSRISVKNMIKKIFLLFVLFAFATNLQAKNKVVVIDVDGGIGPAIHQYIDGGIEYAEDENAEALIIRLNTPGGLVETTRDIVESIMESRVPVIVYVGPGGARAGSAGVFITLSGNIAAMAPGTNIGAAHPVGMGGDGGDSTDVMYDKITNDVAAFVRTIAQNRGKNVEWAEKAVRESVSATEQEALELGVIDFISKDLSELLEQCDGMKVVVDGEEETLNTKNAEIELRGMNWSEEFLQVLTNPNIAYILLMLGIYGIFFELYSPGSIFPGSIGAICIILGAYSMQMLPINYAGVALILLAIVFFIVEIFVTSYGLLTIGGIVSLAVGSVMLIDSPFEFLEISTGIIITVVVFTSLFFIAIGAIGIRAQFRKRKSGKHAMLGEIGVAIQDIKAGEYSNVKVHGEIWKASSEADIPKDSQVEVLAVEGLKINVKKV
jgi:membrane-bound serine protease (ClpP class)